MSPQQQITKRPQAPQSYSAGQPSAGSVVMSERTMRMMPPDSAGGGGQGGPVMQQGPGLQAPPEGGDRFRAMIDALRAKRQAGGKPRAGARPGGPRERGRRRPKVEGIARRMRGRKLRPMESSSA